MGSYTRSDRDPPLSAALRALQGRMQGPGGYYNLGNALGLLIGLGLQVHLAGTVSGIGTFLAGSSAAIALTLANLVFFVSGEVYHRAWSRGFPPDPRLNRRGDLLSAIGAVGLGLGLFMLGQPVLTAFSGLLHAFGKFGSAWHLDVDFPHLWPADWPDPFRSAVLISRVPAIVATLIGLLGILSDGRPATADLLALGSLLVSYVLWMKADLMLFRR